jgi:hypothetical protein
MEGEMPASRFSPGSKSGEPTGDVPAPTVRAVLRAVRDAEVLYIAFPRLHHALVIDLRRDDSGHPAALVGALAVGMGGPAAAVEKLRPGLPPSDRSISTTWGGSTRAFAEQGVLGAILDRLPADGRAGAMAAFEQLRAVERGTVGPATPDTPQDTADEDPAEAADAAMPDAGDERGRDWAGKEIPGEGEVPPGW